MRTGRFLPELSQLSTSKWAYGHSRFFSLSRHNLYEMTNLLSGFMLQSLSGFDALNVFCTSFQTQCHLVQRASCDHGSHLALFWAWKGLYFCTVSYQMCAGRSPSNATLWWETTLEGRLQWAVYPLAQVSLCHRLTRTATDQIRINFIILQTPLWFELAQNSLCAKWTWAHHRTSLPQSLLQTSIFYISPPFYNQYHNPDRTFHRSLGSLSGAA